MSVHSDDGRDSPRRAELERALTAARARYVLGWTSTVVVVSVGALALLVTGDALLHAVRSLPEYFRLQADYAAGAIPWNEYLLAGQHLNVVIAFALVYGGLYLLPFVVTLPMTAPLLVLWREPAQILVLRPFNRRPLTRGLARAVHRDVTRFGHVYTLADAELRVRWYVRVPMLLGQIALLSFRARQVGSARKVERLARAVERTWLRNVNWCLSWRKIFAVASTDSCWQQVVERLMSQASVILIDLTEARPNVLWEIELVQRLRLGSRVVWLLRQGDTVDLQGVDLPMTAVHYYDAGGACDSAKLQTAVAECVLEAGAETRGRRPANSLSVAGLLMFVVGSLPLLSLWSGPVAERLSRSGPQTASFALMILYFAVVTWLVLCAATFVNRNVMILLLAHTMLLLGVVLMG